MSAHPASQRRGLLSSMAAQLAAYVLDPAEETVEAEPVELEPHPVVAVVSAAPKSGATTLARLLGAELAARADGAAVVTCAGATRGAPTVRAAARLAVALQSVGAIRPVGRLCLAEAPDPDALVKAARYLAPVVLDVPPDGSAATGARIADRVVVVAAGAGEPALAAAVRLVLGGDPVVVANRIAEVGAWEGRADALIPDSRLAARAAGFGARPLGPLGIAIADLADALELSWAG